MPFLISLTISSGVSFFLPAWSDTFGMRWNCTLLQLSAYEQPSDSVLPMMWAWSRVAW